MTASNTSDRRAFVTRAASAGLTFGIGGNVLRSTGVSAQDATPQARLTTSAFYTLADDDAEAIWFLGTLALIKGVGSQTGNTLATVEFIHPPEFATVLHVHHTADEAFYVLAGEMRGVCGDRRVAGGDRSVRLAPARYSPRLRRWRQRDTSDVGIHRTCRLRSLRRRGRRAGAGANPAPSRSSGHREAGRGGRQHRHRDRRSTCSVRGHPAS